MSEDLSTQVAYYFYRPVVTEEVCDKGHVHRTTVGHTYHTRMRDGSEVEITKDEYERRPRFERP